MQHRLRRVRNVLVKNRTSHDVGWLIMDEFERARLYQPGMPLPEASNQAPEEELHLNPLQEYLVQTMATRPQPDEHGE